LNFLLLIKKENIQNFNMLHAKRIWCLIIWFIYNRIENNKSQSYAFIIDGQTLANIFDLSLENEFREISMKCDAVLCCRMSPSQKAQVRAGPIF